MYFNICTNLDILIIIHTTNMYMRQAVYLHCIFAISVANLNLLSKDAFCKDWFYRDDFGISYPSLKQT